MIDTSIFLEKYLQDRRFDMVKPYLVGDVLDFGGNKGELGKYVHGDYLVVNYDHSPMEGKTFDTIVCLAVIEHIVVEDVFAVFKKFKSVLKRDGRIYLTTPTLQAKPLLESCATIGILGKQNINEHKHYWSEEDISRLAERNGFKLKEYNTFQMGFNLYAIMEHAY